MPKLLPCNWILLAVHAKRILMSILNQFELIGSQLDAASRLAVTARAGIGKTCWVDDDRALNFT